MAKPGTKPRVTSIELADLFSEGMPDPRATVVSRLIPKAKGGELEASPNLRQNPQALAYFEFYKSTTGIGHLAPIDGPVLEMLCGALAMYDQCMDELSMVPGMVQRLNNGVVMAHPYFTMAMKASEQARKLMTELSLTPVERARMGGGKTGGTVDSALDNARRKYLGASDQGRSRMQEQGED